MIGIIGFSLLIVQGISFIDELLLHGEQLLAHLAHEVIGFVEQSLLQLKLRVLLAVYPLKLDHFLPLLQFQSFQLLFLFPQLHCFLGK